MFKEQVRAFAEEKVRPLVQAMDEEATLAPDLIKACFDLGIMGVEIPEKFRGAGATFFMSVLVIEELARVDASLAVLVDVQNTLVNNALLRWGSEAMKAKYFPRLATEWVGAYALSEAGSGSDAFALACRAEDKGDHYALTGRKLWITNAAEAELFIVMATLDPAKGYKGITSFLVERGFPGFYGGQEGEQARHPRQLHLRADPRGLPGAEGERAGRARQGLQDRHRDPERGPHRDRSPDGGGGPGQLRARPSLCPGAAAVRQAHRRLPGRAVPPGRAEHGDRGRAPA